MEFLIYPGAYQSIFRTRNNRVAKPRAVLGPSRLRFGEATHRPVRTKDCMRTLSHYIILILMIFTNACQYNQDSSPEHILNKSGITKDTYRNLSLCQRLDIVLDIGYDYIDRGHYSVVIPGWLIEGLSSPVDSDNLFKMRGYRL